MRSISDSFHLRSAGGGKGLAAFEKRHAKKLAESGGVRAQGSFAWKLTVKIEPPGESPFEADITARAQSDNTFFPGLRVAVLYDPNDHSKVSFDQGRDSTLACFAEQMADGHPSSSAASVESVLKEVMADPSSAASRGQELAAAMGIDLSTARVHVRGQQDQPAVMQAQRQMPAPSPTAEDPVQMAIQCRLSVLIRSSPKVERRGCQTGCVSEGDGLLWESPVGDDVA